MALSGGIDYTGIAIVIGAATACFSGIVGAGLQIAVFVRQGQQIRATTELHESVNGQSEAFKALIQKEAYGAGEKAGMEGERNRPSEP